MFVRFGARNTFQKSDKFAKSEDIFGFCERSTFNSINLLNYKFRKNDRSSMRYQYYKLNKLANPAISPGFEIFVCFV